MVFRALAWIVIRIFYRVQVTGTRPSRTGAALLLANHPNSLFDPAMVLGCAGRAVRFLAKAPLFDDVRVAWLVRSAGAIPVFRRSDDPSAMSGNDDMFRAVDEALLGGDAIGLFPEGRSHSEPAMSELRTGAARMALSAAHRAQVAPAIVPVGLVFREKEIFRSEAAAVFGEPVDWGDLVELGADDRDAVRELTERIDAALREVTVNLERWEDGPLVQAAVDVWGTERELGGASDDAAPEVDEATRVQRLAVATRLLAEHRGTPTAEALVADLHAHGRRLERLGLDPRSLRSRTQARVAVGWAVSKLHLLALPMLAASVVGGVTFYLPQKLAGLLAGRTSPNRTELATHKLVWGALLSFAWLLVLGVAFAAVWGALAAGALLIVLPGVGVVGRRVRERWGGAWGEARRFVSLRARSALVRELRDDQRRLAERLDQLV